MADKRTKAELLAELEVLTRTNQELNELRKTNNLKYEHEIAELRTAHKREVTDLQVKISILERENNRLEMQLANKMVASIKTISYLTGKADGIMATFKMVTGRIDGEMGLPAPPDSPSAAEDLFNDEDPDDPAY